MTDINGFDRNVVKQQAINRLQATNANKEKQAEEVPTNNSQNNQNKLEQEFKERGSELFDAMEYIAMRGRNSTKKSGSLSKSNTRNSHARRSAASARDNLNNSALVRNSHFAALNVGRGEPSAPVVETGAALTAIDISEANLSFSVTIADDVKNRITTFQDEEGNVIITDTQTNTSLTIQPDAEIAPGRFEHPVKDTSFSISVTEEGITINFLQYEINDYGHHWSPAPRITHTYNSGEQITVNSKNTLAEYEQALNNFNEEYFETMSTPSDVQSSLYGNLSQAFFTSPRYPDYMDYITVVHPFGNNQYQTSHFDKYGREPRKIFEREVKGLLGLSDDAELDLNPSHTAGDLSNEKNLSAASYIDYAYIGGGDPYPYIDANLQWFIYNGEFYSVDYNATGVTGFRVYDYDENTHKIGNTLKREMIFEYDSNGLITASNTITK